MKIFPKLLISFLLLSLLPIVLFSIFVYRTIYTMTINEEIHVISELAKTQIRSVTQFFDHLEEDAMTVAYSNDVLNLFQGKPDEAHAYLKYALDQYGLGDIFLIKNDGEVIYSFQNAIAVGTNLNSGIYEFTELAKVFRQSATLLEPTYSAFEYFSPTKKPVVFLSVPILIKGSLIGVFAVEIPAEKIYYFFENYTGLGETGETLVGKKEGNTALFVNRLRHRPDSAFKFSVNLGDNFAFPIQNAVEGRSGSGISVDYREEKILAVWDYIPYLQLGIVIKIDLNEVLKPVRAIFKIITYFIFAIIISVVGVVIYLSNSISKPIQKLQEGMAIVGAGDLNYHVGTDANDEIGYLSRAFDQMVKNLKHSMTSIDNLNEEIARRKEAEEARSNLFAMASHELRGPIGPINELLKIILQGRAGEVNPEQKKLLSAAQHSASRLLKVINDILDFRKLEVGQMKYTMSMGNLNETLKQAEHMIQDVVKEKGLQLKLELQPDLPNTLFDPDRLLQVVTNLINNALNFTGSGSITLKSSQVNGEVRIEVTDTGVGIAKEDIPKLFKEFSQVGQNIGGTGLGLAICKMIIKDHGGKIWVESEKGKGSSFIFTLPIKA